MIMTFFWIMLGIILGPSVIELLNATLVGFKNPATVDKVAKHKRIESDAWHMDEYEDYKTRRSLH